MGVVLDVVWYLQGFGTRICETQFEPIWKVVGEHWGEAPYPTLTGIGVTWLYGFQFEIKVVAKLPQPA
ncbi:RutC family protein YjgH [Ralstonia mannitolilytica]|uniref:RutC family protein YjgH n=1 Tax=Ralstonia mannitolilytica TaxID=105219 RepID=A0AAD2AJ50_9RALS|nr:RutC family protein YjgH [Ralstonia mannitolilytica]CAJ0719000.1 RutC family protein YjgH [Ralstonia mannitolilytica]CAJ0861798.1 RutC family protein YjgH [Ralstonia mannitolilytica]CAJ0864806.1 RutC family protein YjgH [Ralstonia mannitolilytica]